MKPVRVGVVGAGVMGKRHLAALAGCPMAEVVAVADHHGDLSATVPVVPDVDELLRLTVDAVIIATPAVTHRSVLERCLARGVHALVEKPLATTREDVLAMLDLAGSGPLVAVGHVERFSPAVAMIRRRVRKGAPEHITTRRLGQRPERVRDIGVLLDLAVHDIDLVRWVTGRDYVHLALQAEHANGSGFELSATLAGRLDDGTEVTHEVSWLAQQPVRCWTLAGADAREQVVDLLPASPAALAAQDEAFLAACLGETPGGSLATIADAAVAVQLALTAVGSRATTGRAGLLASPAEAAVVVPAARGDRSEAPT